MQNGTRLSSGFATHTVVINVIEVIDVIIIPNRFWNNGGGSRVFSLTFAIEMILIVAVCGKLMCLKSTHMIKRMMVGVMTIVWMWIVVVMRTMMRWDTIVTTTIEFAREHE
jgi:hypothetical protein